MKIVIISPTFNEKVNIKKLIPLLTKEIFPKIKNHQMHLLIIDDDSPDGTAEVVREFMKKFKNVNLLSGAKKGLGAAYIKGMQYAMHEMKADAIMEFDADFQHDPQDIPKLINAMDEGADYVIGSRYVQGGTIPKEWGIHRKIISRLGGLFAQAVLMHFNIHDMTSGFKLTKTSFLKKVDLNHLYSQYYAYKLHILHDILKQGAKVAEVPIIFYERKEGSSKITRKDLFDSLWVVIRLRLRDSARFIKFLIVGGTGFIVQLIVTYLLNKIGTEQFISAMVGGEGAILSNFFINNFWTFSDAKTVGEQSNFLIRLAKFNLTSLASVGLQGLVVFIAVKLLGEELMLFGRQIHTNIAILFPTIILIVVPLNYIIYNKIIWKTQKLKK